MDLTVVQYAGFVVTALILIWAVIEINKRLYRRDKSQTEAPNHWAELDTKRLGAREEPPLQSSHAHVDEEEAERAEELHTRAKQNGHHQVESQKPQL